jgi:hypothetical protein
VGFLSHTHSLTRSQWHQTRADSREAEKNDIKLTLYRKKVKKKEIVKGKSN